MRPRSLASAPLLRRALHIVQAPTHPSLASITDNIPLIENATSESQQPVFNVLGTPGSILQVSLPPSTPLYAKRKSLLSISTPASTNGSADAAEEPAESKIFSTLQFLSLFNVYQRLTSTVPISLTLSAPTAPGASIVVVELNGTVDWWVNGRYRHILAFASTPASTLTVAGHGAKSRVTGRGIIALSARSLNIFRVGLAPGESFLVRRAALLGYSIDDPFRTRVTYDDTISTAATEATAVVDAPPVSKVREIFNGLWARTKAAVSWLNRNNEFVKVHGPATLLVDSAAGAPTASSSPISIKLGGSIEREVAKAIVAEQSGGAPGKVVKKDDPKHYLKYANIGTDGKATFESTSSFKDFKA